ncbi:DUF262 domain-containing protein [Peribacillus sp. SCS-26]|uniref:GmrSD restriction endonuclease domain-containing protein n=1 Tax=Paraperibacillus marinus TaxID=3115295 RepID=UPI003906AC3A
MNISPKGMSILEAYNLYRKGELIVNRKYQRKLVWAPYEKTMLIDSIMRGYPLPLFLFAKNISTNEYKGLEILDGVQRLTAIFDFIENRIAWEEKRFDLNVFPSANENRKNGIFKVNPNIESLEVQDPKVSSEFLNYQLAVTTFESISEESMIDVFGRINSQGRQLSLQEKRQAGVINEFSEMVREIAEMLRGDASRDILCLYDMPEISLDDSRTASGYKVSIEDMFWYQVGVLGRPHIRNSEDEEIIADLLCSIILDRPFEVSRENLDSLYDENSKLYHSVIINLKRISSEKIKRDFLKVFEVVRSALSEKIDGQNFRAVVSGQTRNAVKYSFYAVFMAMYRLIIKERMVPKDEKEIIHQLKGLQSRLVQGRHSVKEEDRKDNISVVNGLIRDLFILDENHRVEKLGTEYEFETILSLAKTETEAFEFKQGLYSISPKGIRFNPIVIEKVLKTAVAMANRASKNTSYIFIGIADNEQDANWVQENLKEDYLTVSQKYIVGIDGEINAVREDLDSYIRRFVSEVDKHNVTEAIKSQVKLFNIRQYRGKQVIEIAINTPADVSMFENEIYIREGSNTNKIDASKSLEKVLEVGKRFGNK